MSFTAFKTFLNTHKVHNQSPHTHTSIGPPYGKYYIDNHELDHFYDLYSACAGKIKLYIAEKAMDIGKLMIDIDFKQSTADRQYSFHDICGLLNIINTIIREIDLSVNLDAAILIKENPAPSGVIFKDGIHIIYDQFVASSDVRKEITYRAIKKAKEVKLFGNLTLLNNIEDIIDQAIINNSMLLYGSSKFGTEPYKYAFHISSNLTVDNKFIFVNQKEITKRLSIYSYRPSYILDLNIPKIEKHFPIKTISTHDFDKNMISDLLNILLYRRSENYNDWLKVGFVIKNINPEWYDLFDQFSQKCSSKHNPHINKHIWDNMVSSDKGLTIGSLLWWAKQDNPIEYDGIIFKHHMNKNDVTVNI